MRDTSHFKRSKGLNTHETMMLLWTMVAQARYDKESVCLMVWQKKEPGSDSPFKDTPSSSDEMTSLLAMPLKDSTTSRIQTKSVSCLTFRWQCSSYSNWLDTQLCLRARYRLMFRNLASEGARHNL